MPLRPYQEQAIEMLRQSFAKKHKNVVLCGPTGSGKTQIFSEIALRATQNPNSRKVLILTDRLELLSQAGNTLSKKGLNVGFITAKSTGFLPSSKVIVGMVETYNNRLNKGRSIDNLGLIIIDEAHKGNFKKIIEKHSDVRIIGATATPLSASKKDPMNNYFSDIVVYTDIPELLEQGFLAKPTYYAVPLSFEIKAKTGSNGDYKTKELYEEFNKASLYEGCVENYKAHALGKKTIVFCVNIEHAEKTTEKFREMGFQAECITSNTTKENPYERQRILKWFAKTPDAIVTNCGVLTTGFDEPTIECVILNRATKSLPLYLQMVGRGSRVTPEKNSFSIIDMGDNLHNHGRWELKRNWQNIFLYPPEAKKKRIGEDIKMIKYCPNEECGKQHHISVSVCDNCGHIFAKEKAPPSFALTKEVNPIEFAHLFDTPPEQMNVDELIIRAELGNKETGKKYKKGWILHQLKQREDAKAALEEYAQKMGYKKNWVHFQINEETKNQKL